MGTIALVFAAIVLVELIITIIAIRMSWRQLEFWIAIIDAIALFVLIFVTINFGGVIWNCG